MIDSIKKTEGKEEWCFRSVLTGALVCRGDKNEIFKARDADRAKMAAEAKDAADEMMRDELAAKDVAADEITPHSPS